MHARQDIEISMSAYEEYAAEMSALALYEYENPIVSPGADVRLLTEETI